MTKKFREPKDPVGTVAELFAGVGGFRIGLASAGWKTVFSNQWEPATKVQHASSVYVANFGEDGHFSEDIAKVQKIPKKFDLLVGGFPCQDYSVAKTLKSARGLKGKKGVLWWEILRLVESHKPRFIFLENVDRLLKSPSTQRGRDFAVMLRSLGDFGYFIEWRVVNSAEYGYPQRRIRVYIVARKKEKQDTSIEPFDFITSEGILAKALPISTNELICSDISLKGSLEQISKTFNRGIETRSPFLNAGIFLDGVAHTLKVNANPKQKVFRTLGDVLLPESQVSSDFYVSASSLKKWKALKAGKKIERIHRKTGYSYFYTEGSMAFPDLPNNPSRTILTGEGGTSPSRFKHIIKTKNGYRRLTPIELERLNGFPDDWTKYGKDGEVIQDSKRAFLMGNALVVGIIQQIGESLAKHLKK